MKEANSLEIKEILKELKNIYGLEKCENSIKRYIDYLKLRSEGKINMGNYNVLIKCKNDYSQIEQLVEIIVKLLKKYNIANSSYLYVDERQLRNIYRISDISDQEIVIVDSDIVNLSSYHIQEQLKQCINDNKNKIFILVDRETQNFWKDDFKSKELFWTFEFDEASEDDKTKYIKQVLKENEIKIDNNCNLINAMSNNNCEKVQKDLFNIIIECKSKNINRITDKVLEDLDKREYLRIRTKSKSTNNKKTAIQELETMEGLETVKEQIQHILNYIKINKNRGTLPSLHMSFEGNPGSGKTSVARIIGKIFAEEKILSNNKTFVEINARELVAKYVGWTAVQTKEIVEKAEGGVLFIDEAYALISDKQGFEQEAIDTLIKLMEDKRDNICIIFAGYTKEMQQLFDMNPGFASRINFHIQFSDYSEEELYNIFRKMLKQEKYKLSNNTKDILIDYFKKEKAKEHFANGRCVRNLFERIKFEQADRVVLDAKQDINLVKKCDIKNTIQQLRLEQVDIKRRIGFTSGN